jgi:hypothetical protein
MHFLDVASSAAYTLNRHQYFKPFYLKFRVVSGLAVR